MGTSWSGLGSVDAWREVDDDLVTLRRTTSLFVTARSTNSWSGVELDADGERFYLDDGEARVLAQLLTEAVGG